MVGPSREYRTLSPALDLGLLEQIRTEVNVGSFWADILCKDIVDHAVVIENQFAKSDHRLFGQLMP